MPKSRRKKDAPEGVEANLIPVLSCMFLLIPALLLAMEVANWASVTVFPPQATNTPSPEQQTPKEVFRFTVNVRGDGFVATVGRGTSKEAATQIPLLAAGEDPYDYDKLTEHADQLKRLFPRESQVNVTAEGDVDYQTLIRTMDALRGDACSLAGAAANEEAPEGCLFWNVVVQS